MMYVIGAFVLGGLLFSIVTWADGCYTKTGENLAKFFTALCSIALVFSLIFIIGFETNIEIDETVVERIELVNLQDNSQIGGYGGRCYVKITTSEVYCYYYRLDDGGVKLGKVRASEATIYQGDYIPCIKTIEACKKPYGMTVKQSKFWLFHEGEKFYEIYVPEGTVVEEFNLDAH